MACVDVFQALRSATENLGKDIHRKATDKSVWLNAVPKGAFPLGVGLEQTTFTVENSQPVNDELAWQKIGDSNVSGDVNMDTGDGLCARSWEDVEWGMSEQKFAPERVSIRGPQVCQPQLKYRHNVDSFLRAYLEEITKHSKSILENKIRNEYMKKGRQVTISGDGGNNGAEALNDISVNSKDISDSTNALADTVELREEHLNQLAVKLIESGATEGDSSGWVELGANGPVFPLIIGMEAAHKLLKTDGDIRLDYRHGAANNELLKRLGADKVVGNFRLIVVTDPPRFKRNSGDTGYDRISRNVALGSSEITKGSGTKLNPRYTGKDISDGDGVYEAAIVLNPSVMRQLVVPSTTPGPLAFSPEDYSGSWKFITGAYKWGGSDPVCEDPTESFGRHVGMYEMAFEPIFGDHGATLLFKRDGVVA